MIKTTVKDSYQLNELLNKKYGDRLETDPILALAGTVQGTLDSKRIKITFGADEYLLISTNPNSREILDELLPVLTEVMGGQQPICSYDLRAVDETDSMPTIEWDIAAPEDRITNIVNGRAFSDGAKIYNLKLYNSKNIEDYLETDEEKQERIKNAKIYGIYPGCCNPDEIANMSELDLFFLIASMDDYIWRSMHEMYHGRIEEIDLTEEQYAYEYMIYQTTKFGVELAEPTIGKHIDFTPSYEAWYKFYSNHFKHTLCDIEFKAFQKARKEGKDISNFMPEGSWKDLLEENNLKKELK